MESPYADFLPTSTGMEMYCGSLETTDMSRGEKRGVESMTKKRREEKIECLSDAAIRVPFQYKSFLRLRTNARIFVIERNLRQGVSNRFLSTPIAASLASSSASLTKWEGSDFRLAIREYHGASLGDVLSYPAGKKKLSEFHASPYLNDTLVNRFLSFHAWSEGKGVSVHLLHCISHPMLP